MISPFAPYLAEELWEMIGKKKFISLSEWPKYDKKRISKEVEFMEELIENTNKDISHIKDLSGIIPTKLQIFISEPWKYDLMKNIKREIENTRDVGVIIKKVMIKGYEKDVAAIVSSVIKDQSKLPTCVLTQKEEFTALNDAKDLISKQFNCGVEVVKAEESKEGKARQAMPGKPAILLK